MKKKREFINELYSNKIEKVPFLEYFQNDKYLRCKLFAEYLKTETEHNFILYLNSHYSKNELDKGFKEMSDKISISKNKNSISNFVPKTEFEKEISDLKIKFYDLVIECKLPEKYFSHSIIKTNIIEKLKFVSQKIKDFELFVLSETYNNGDKYAAIFAENIIKNLESIGMPTLKNKILNEFLNKQTNINIDIAFHFETLSTNQIKSISKKEIYRKYSELKMFADAYIRNYLESLDSEEMELKSINEDSNCKPKKNKSETILSKLNKYNFSELETLKGIDLTKLAKDIFNNDLPYQIAYLDFLGFIKHLNDNYCNSQTELHKLLSEILTVKNEKAVNERAVKGNINGLRNIKSLDRKRYTAFQHIENVKAHYRKLK